MIKLSVLICCLLFGFSFSQNLDGVWINEELRSSLLDGSLELKDTEVMTPMFFKISKGKVANFYQVESSVTPRYKSLKKITKDKYTDGLFLYTFVNKNTISYKTKKKNITFIRNLNSSMNDIFDTKKSFTKNYIKFTKLSIIKYVHSNKEFNIKCINDGNEIRCVYDKHKFSYTIYSSNPYYYNKSWNKLKFYMDTNINNTKRTYLLEKQTNNSYHLKDLTTDTVEYIFK